MRKKDAKKAFESLEKPVTPEDNFTSPNKELELTELNFAKYFSNKNKGKIMFTDKNKIWLVWEKPTWKNDEVVLHETIKSFIRNLYPIAKTKKNEKRKQFSNAIKRLQSKRKIQDVLDLASKERGIRIEDELVDSQPGLLNCTNVMIDLSNETFQIVEHDSKKWICKQTGLEYKKDATCPNFLKFLDTIFESKKDLIDFVQKAIGYSLTGYTSEQCLFFMYGTGRNGKSTFAEILKLLFGDYYYKANIDIILEQRGNPIRNDIAALKGRRLVLTSEVASGKKLDESMVKDLTGCDEITARCLYKEFTTFKPELKLWMYGNHRPVITGSDEGIKRRIKLIPFNVCIPEANIRPMESIMEDMKEELPGILNWALEGFNMWRADKKLIAPEEVKQATNEYLSEMDKVQIFLDNCCTFESSDMVTAKALHQKYLDFCDSNGDKPLGKRTFESQLKVKNLKIERKSQGVSFWMGVDVKTGD